MYQKKNQFFLLFAIEMAVLSVFLQKKGLGPLGISLGVKQPMWDLKLKLVNAQMLIIS